MTPVPPQQSAERQDDGGPAFPCSNEQYTYGNPQTGDAHAGMTLRDWFAGRAISAIIRENPYAETKALARDAYRVADAMLAARTTLSEAKTHG